jgi:hypothetical protein
MRWLLQKRYTRHEVAARTGWLSAVGPSGRTSVCERFIHAISTYSERYMEERSLQALMS